MTTHGERSEPSVECCAGLAQPYIVCPSIVPEDKVLELLTDHILGSGSTHLAELTSMSSSETDVLSGHSSSATNYSVEFELVTAKQWEEEWTARDTASVRLQLLGRVLCCRNKPRIRWIRSKGAILILLWNCLILGYYGNLGFTLAGALELNSVHARGVIYLILMLIQSLSQLLLYSLAGWIADVYFGRYRMIKASLWLMWAGLILLGSSLCLDYLLIDGCK